MPVATRWRPSVAHVALLLPWVLVVVAARSPVGDNSFLWHITAGIRQLELNEVLTSDPFSFTFFGEAWRTQSWLAELGYAALHAEWGLAFVPWMVGAVAALTFALVLALATRVGGSVEAAALIGVLTAWLGAGFMNPRPVLLSYLAFAALIIAVHSRLRWALPLIVWVWAAVHGTFVLGIAYVILDGLRRRDRTAITDGVAMTVAASLTAHGLALWFVLVEFAGSRDALALISEWRTPNLGTVEMFPYFIGVVVLLIGGIQRNITSRDLWIVVPFLGFGFMAARSVFPAWLALLPMLAVSLRGLPRASRRSSGTPVALGAIAALILVGPFLLPTESGLSEKFPVESAAAISSDRVFHDDVIGGYLIYRYEGQTPVFVDDRAELYGGEHFRRVVETRNGTPTWKALFAEWDINQALVRIEDGLADALIAEGWRVRFRDDRFLVLEEMSAG